MKLFVHQCVWVCVSLCSFQDFTPKNRHTISYNSLNSTAVASAPTDLKAEQVGLTEVRLSWTPPSPLGDTLDYIVSYSYHKSQFSEDIEEYAGGDGSTDKFIVMGFDVGRSYNLTVMGASQHFPSDPVTTTIYIG